MKILKNINLILSKIIGIESYTNKQDLKQRTKLETSPVPATRDRKSLSKITGKLSSLL